MSICYDFYTDESNTHGGHNFYLGALICTPARAAIIKRAIARLRAELQCDGEFKWTKVSKAKIELYCRFVEIFLHDPYVVFRLLEVVRKQDWKRWDSSEEQRFFRSYYVFFRRNMGPSYRYGFYMDDLCAKKYRWKQMEYALNANENYVGRSKQVHTVSPVDSHKNDLLQLTDVLLGAMVSLPEADPKKQLCRLVNENIEMETASKYPKFRFFRFEVRQDEDENLLTEEDTPPNMRGKGHTSGG